MTRENGTIPGCPEKIASSGSTTHSPTVSRKTAGACLQISNMCFRSRGVFDDFDLLVGLTWIELQLTRQLARGWIREQLNKWLLSSRYGSVAIDCVSLAI